MRTQTIILLAGIALLLGVLLFTSNARQQEQARSEAATRAHEKTLVAPFETARAAIPTRSP